MALHTAGDAPLGFLATFTDITDIMRDAGRRERLLAAEQTTRSERKGLEEQRERLLEAELAGRRSAELVQRQLEQQNEKLRELDEAKTQFVATVSHELRTPLTSIVSFSELMRAETRSLTPDGAQFLDIIERNAHRLLRLVGDLLLLAGWSPGASRWSWLPCPSPNSPRRRRAPPGRCREAWCYRPFFG